MITSQLQFFFNAFWAQTFSQFYGNKGLSRGVDQSYYDWFRTMYIIGCDRSMYLPPSLIVRCFLFLLFATLKTYLQPFHMTNTGHCGRDEKVTNDVVILSYVNLTTTHLQGQTHTLFYEIMVVSLASKWNGKIHGCERCER